MVATGFVRVIANLEYGDHLCCFYDTSEEHRAVLTPFLRRGLEQGDRVLGILAQENREILRAYLLAEGLQVEAYLTSGQLDFLSAADTCTEEGHFNPDRLIALFERQTERAMAEGYTALRIYGEMGWILRGLTASRRLVEFKDKLHHFLQDRRCLALFQYDRRQFDPTVLLDVLRTHPVTIVGTLVHENLYSIPPAEFLAGDMAEESSIAALALENTRLYAQAKRRMQELEALYRADQEIHRCWHVDQVLQSLVDVAVDIFQADKSSLMVWDPQEESLVLRAARGFRSETMAQIPFGWGEGIANRVVASGEPILVENACNDDRLATKITEAEGIRSFMHLPIKIGDSIFGVFNVNYTQAHAFSKHDQRLFMSLAQRAATAIENAHLCDQAEELVSLRERQRIAEALHDTVAQVLFSIGLEARWCMEHLALEEETQKRLRAIRRLAAQGSEELRSTIFALHSPHLAGSDGLTDLLNKQVAEFQAQTGIAATFIAPAQIPSLPREVREAIYRIVRESLSNVHKHAQASAVVVSLHCDQDELTVTVQDDGGGLSDPEALKRGERTLHFGVATMRQAAEQAQGSLLIANNEDRGVGVKAHFPLGGGPTP
ncbi:MAG: MEDS domain-containing protein [Chloroflexia bacterium]|nr:MEDS domain-containing protein [Chloroflexia bacterium]